jgi:hypothetical protein
MAWPCSRGNRCASETFATYKIESDDLVLCDAIEFVVSTKPQATRFGKFGRPVGRKDAHQMSVRGIVFANSRDGIWRSERVLARFDDVAVGSDRKIEETEFWIADESDRLLALAWVKRNESVVACPIRAGPRGEN